MLRFELGIQCPQLLCTTHNTHEAQIAHDSVFIGKMVYNPSWMGHRVSETCRVYTGNFPEKTQGQYSIPTIKVNCGGLFLLLLSHPDAALLGTMKM